MFALFVASIAASLITGAVAAKQQASEAKRVANYNKAVAEQRAQQRLEIGAGQQIRLAREGIMARGEMTARAAAGGQTETAYTLFAQAAADNAMDQQQSKMNALNEASGYVNEGDEQMARGRAAANQAWMTFAGQAAQTGFNAFAGYGRAS